MIAETEAGPRRSGLGSGIEHQARSAPLRLKDDQGQTDLREQLILVAPGELLQNIFPPSEARRDRTVSCENQCPPIGAPAIGELRAEMRTRFAKRLRVTPQQLDGQGRLPHSL